MDLIVQSPDVGIRAIYLVPTGENIHTFGDKFNEMVDEQMTK